LLKKTSLRSGNRKKMFYASALPIYFTIMSDVFHSHKY
jgi:hypothetical protein